MCERGRKAAEGMIQIDSEFISIVGREPGRTEGWHFGGGYLVFTKLFLGSWFVSRWSGRAFFAGFFLESELWEMARKWEGEIAFRSGRDHLGR